MLAGSIIEHFGDAKEGWLRKHLQLPHGIPMEDTFARVFAALHPEEFYRRFLCRVKAVHCWERRRSTSTASAHGVPGMSRMEGTPVPVHAQGAADRRQRVRQ